MFYRTGAEKAKVGTTEGQENSEWSMRKRDIKHTPKLMFSMAPWEAAATFKNLKPQWCGSICSTQWVVLISLAGGSCETASGDSHPWRVSLGCFSSLQTCTCSFHWQTYKGGFWEIQNLLYIAGEEKVRAMARWRQSSTVHLVLNSVIPNLFTHIELPNKDTCNVMFLSNVIELICLISPQITKLCLQKSQI